MIASLLIQTATSFKIKWHSKYNFLHLEPFRSLVTLLEHPVDYHEGSNDVMAGVVQVPPFGEGVGPGVAGRGLGRGAEHDAQVGQVEHGEQAEHKVYEYHPGCPLAVL